MGFCSDRKKIVVTKKEGGWWGGFLLQNKNIHFFLVQILTFSVPKPCQESDMVQKAIEKVSIYKVTVQVPVSPLNAGHAIRC